MVVLYGSGNTNNQLPPLAHATHNYQPFASSRHCSTPFRHLDLACKEVHKKDTYDLVHGEVKDCCKQKHCAALPVCLSIPQVKYTTSPHRILIFPVDQVSPETTKYQVSVEGLPVWVE